MINNQLICGPNSFWNNLNGPMVPILKAPPPPPAAPPLFVPGPFCPVGAPVFYYYR
jgi:hypothetical protein